MTPAHPAHEAPLPCPFCGRPVTATSTFGATPERIPVQHPDSDDCQLRHYVGNLAQWNRRAPSPLPATAPAVLLSRDHFHATYNGGYTREGMDDQRSAFHHGMDTVFNALDDQLRHFAGRSQGEEPEDPYAGRYPHGRSQGDPAEETLVDINAIERCAKCLKPFTIEQPKVLVGDTSRGYFVPRFAAHQDCARTPEGPPPPSPPVCDYSGIKGTSPAHRGKPATKRLRGYHICEDCYEAIMELERREGDYYKNLPVAPPSPPGETL